MTMSYIEFRDFVKSMNDYIQSRDKDITANYEKLRALMEKNVSIELNDHLHAKFDEYLAAKKALDEFIAEETKPKKGKKNENAHVRMQSVPENKR